MKKGRKIERKHPPRLSGSQGPLSPAISLEWMFSSIFFCLFIYLFFAFCTCCTVLQFSASSCQRRVRGGENKKQSILPHTACSAVFSLLSLICLLCLHFRSNLLSYFCPEILAVINRERLA